VDVEGVEPEELQREKEVKKGEARLKAHAPPTLPFLRT
jgi:hypothetical protein